MRMRRAIFVLVPLLAVTILLAIDLLGPQEGEQKISLEPTSTPTETSTPPESPTMVIPSPSKPPSVAAFISTSLPATAQASPSPPATLSPIATETGLLSPAPSPITTETSLPSPSATEAASPPPTPTETASPSLSPATAETGIPSATVSLLLQPTATSTPVETPLPGGPFGPLVFSAGITEDHKPLSIGKSFPASTERVYAFFEYKNIEDGTPWSYVWYWNGEQVGDGSGKWEWGSSGRSWVFHDILGAGRYELKLYVKGKLVQQGSFYIRRR